MPLLLPGEPLFCLPARAYRCYLGGALLDPFLSATLPCHAEDSHFPEAWIASTTPADNGPGHPAEEGLCQIRLPDGTTGINLREALADLPADFFGRGLPAPSALPMLCKFLDSAIRLPVQCHPDKEFARQHYHSAYGKSECWMILATRRINGEDPYLLMGFRPGVTPEQFADCVARDDSPAMAALLNKIPVRPGDAWYIPGRFPHAIGPGVFMLEVQEPSDWVVQPESACGDTPLSEATRFGPLARAEALQCFRYQGETAEEVRARLAMPALEEIATPGGTVVRLADERYGDCFVVRRADVRSQLTLPQTRWQLAIATAGTGTLQINGRSYPIRPGDACLIPDRATVTMETSQTLFTMFLIQA